MARTAHEGEVGEEPARAPHAGTLDEIYRTAVDLGLDRNLAELDAYGYTVVSPEAVGAPELTERLAEAMLRVDRERAAGPRNAEGRHSNWYLLGEDPAFEEAIQRPVVLTLLRYLLGPQAMVGGLTSIIKGPGPRILPLHSDNNGIPAPFPAWAQICNISWACTDYTEDGGCLAVVPGSHRLGRHPEPEERDWRTGNSRYRPVPVETPAGSVIAWHGNTWHGAYPRSLEGQRMTMVLTGMRPYLRPINDWSTIDTADMLARNPPEFATLLGLDSPFPQPPKMYHPDQGRRIVRLQQGAQSLWG